MSEAILQATIRAYDEFTRQFEKFQQELNKTAQAEQKVTASTQSVNEAMTGLILAKTKAREATEKYNKVITEMHHGGKQGAEASTRLAVALNEVVAAERRVEQETVKLNTTLGAYNLTSKEAQVAIRQVDRALDDLSRQHQQHGMHANNDMMQTMALVSAFYGLVRVMQEVMQTGREFELGIKQSQAVTGDMTSALRDFAMEARDSIYAPKQMAETFYSLGSAGLSANETLMATPAILDFATAGLIDVDSAAYATISTIKAFRLEWEQATEVTDAFTEAMNSTTLNAPDFRFVMATAGAVGKLAAQDFREVVAAAAAMKDAGVQAQDAGTSIKAAFLALMSPADEAKDIIDELGIKIYDASGQMKQWHEIVAEFEQALAPYNDEARNMILSTVLGTDGIRAMATSLNMGSETLFAYVEEMKAADGATQKMADTMADTFDGALRKVNGNLERSKILLFEDLAPASTTALGAINTLIIGFNSLDDSGRSLIETLVGGAGLIVAIKALIGTARMLGITLAMVTGPIGLTIMAVTALTGAVLAYQGHQEKVNQEIEESVRKNLSLADSIGKLLAKYEELSNKSELTQEEQDQLKHVIKDLTDAVPPAITGFDAMGNAITNVGTASEEARRKMAELREEAVRNAEINAQIARAQLPELERKKSEAAAERDKLQGYISSGNYAGAYLTAEGPLKGLRQLTGLFKSDKEIAYEVGNLAAKAREAYDAANKELIAAEAAIKLADDFSSGKSSSQKTAGGSTTQPSSGSGTKQYTKPDTSKEKNKAQEAAKSYVDAITAALYPYKTAVDAATSAVSVLGAKEQYLNQIMQSGQGTVYQAVELNKVRTEQMAALADQQDKLTKKAEAEAKQLSGLQEQYKKAANPEAANVLLKEIERLTGSLYQYGQAWWQIEQQKQSMAQKTKQEEKKRFDDAYQQAMELMRHQVNMAWMSTEQQIEYLTRLRDAHAWTQQQMWSIEENLYRLRRQQLSDYLSDMEDGYRDSLDALDKRTRETVKGLQDQIDDLDAEGVTSDRDEATRKHNEKLAELQDKRKFHELRTGKEHKNALSELDKEIAEEDRAWQLQQDEWAREDKKKSLRDQIEATNEGAKEERKRLEDHYREVVDLANKGALDTLAALAATNPQWLETGKNWIKNLMDGISLMEPEFQARVQQATNLMGGYKAETPASSTSPSIPGQGVDSPVAAIAPGQYIMAGGRPAMWSRELANLLGGLSVNWESGKGTVNIGGKSFTPLQNDGGKSYVSITDAAQALGYRADLDGMNGMIKIYKAALGGIFTRPSMAMIAEAGYDEAVLPLHQLQPMINEAVGYSLARETRMMTPREAFFSTELSAKIDRLIVALEHLPDAKAGGTTFHGPLFHADKVELEDEADIQIFARELGRSVRQIVGG